MDMQMKSAAAEEKMGNFITINKYFKMDYSQEVFKFVLIKLQRTIPLFFSAFTSLTTFSSIK